MRRHESEPAKLIAGLVLLGAGIMSALDAIGRVNMPPAALVVLMPAGLCLAGCAGGLTYRMRRRRARRRERNAPPLADLPMDGFDRH